MKKNDGYSVVEILVVVGIFAILSIIAAQAIILTLRSERKNDSLLNVKEEIDYAANVIERNLQTAKYIIVDPISTCDGVTATASIGFSTPYGDRGDFGCINTNLTLSGNQFYNSSNPDKFVASASGYPNILQYNQRLTSEYLEIETCEFKCNVNEEKAYVEFFIVASAKNLPDSDDNKISARRRIFVRTSERK